MKYKRIKISTKAQAQKIKLSSKVRKLTKERLAFGDFDWTGQAKDYAGAYIIVPDFIEAVWVERRVKKDGPYAAPFCLTPEI